MLNAYSFKAIMPLINGFFIQGIKCVYCIEYH